MKYLKAFKALTLSVALTAGERDMDAGRKLRKKQALFLPPLPTTLLTRM